MVLTNKYTKDLINKFTQFGNSKSLPETISLFCDKDSEVNEHVVFIALTRFFIDDLIKFNSNITPIEKEIYDYLEIKLNEFSNFEDNTEEGLFTNAICVCFFENLLNNASHDVIKYDRFIPYLGKKSKAFCKAWDQFTEVRSSGLWGEEEWINAIKEKK